MPTIAAYHRYLQAFQSERLRRDHADLAAQPQYRALAEFFFGELYGPRDFSARDEGARRLQHFLHLAPGLHLRDLEQALELMELTYGLDDDLARQLRASGAGLPFDEPAYEQAYRAADNYEQRLRQLDLVHATLNNVHRIARLPLIGATLQSTRALARLMDMGPLHSFLGLGYSALSPLESIDHFNDTLYARELARLDRIYLGGVGAAREPPLREASPPLQLPFPKL
jgi:hypothetical protein